MGPSTGSLAGTYNIVMATLVWSVLWARERANEVKRGVADKIHSNATRCVRLAIYSSRERSGPSARAELLTSDFLVDSSETGVHDDLSMVG